MLAGDGNPQMVVRVEDFQGGLGSRSEGRNRFRVGGKEKFSGEETCVLTSGKSPPGTGKNQGL